MVGDGDAETLRTASTGDGGAQGFRHSYWAGMESWSSNTILIGNFYVKVTQGSQASDCISILFTFYFLAIHPFQILFQCPIFSTAFSAHAT